jgi:hypothetical protein
MLKAVEDFREGLDPTEKPQGFPFWGTQHLIEVPRRHPTIQEEGSCKDPLECDDCHEYQVWRGLEWWYQQCFMNRDTTEMMISADGTEVAKLCRLYSLVLLGERETGKTKFFEACCNMNEKRISIFKGEINRHEAKKIPNCWTILLDDFRDSPADYEMLQAAVAADKATLNAKWLQEDYRGGKPCVICTNKANFYRKLKQDKIFYSQCKFIDLDNLWIGPPGKKGERKVKMTGPKTVEKQSRTTYIDEYRSKDDQKYDQQRKKLRFEQQEVALRNIKSTNVLLKEQISYRDKENKNLEKENKTLKRQLESLQKGVVLSSIAGVYREASKVLEAPSNYDIDQFFASQNATDFTRMNTNEFL